MSGAQLSVCMEKDLELEYLGEIRFVHKVEIGGCEILIYRNPKKKKEFLKRIYPQTIRKERRDHEISVCCKKGKKKKRYLNLKYHTWLPLSCWALKTIMPLT